MLETATNCTNCGAPKTVDNNGDFCKFCGAKFPVQNEPITNNIQNVHNVTNITNVTNVIHQAPEPVMFTDTVSEFVPEKKPSIVRRGALIAGVVLIIIGIITRINTFALFGFVSIIVAILFPPNTNYCTFCRGSKSPRAKICPHCGKARKTPLYKTAAVIVILFIMLFIWLVGKIG